jgi:hypothetical protein
MISEKYRLKRNSRHDTDRKFDCFRFELAVSIYSNHGNVTPLTSEGKLIPEYPVKHVMSQHDLVTFFALLGFDPGIVTKNKITHYKPISIDERKREHLTIERWLDTSDEVEIDDEY